LTSASSAHQKAQDRHARPRRSSGITFDKLLERLGIADEIRAKAKLKQGGYVAELVASGDAELAVHQISEIVPVKGVTPVGP